MNSEQNQVPQSNPNTAYILNVFLPGIGNLYFGQPVLGTLTFLLFLLAIFLFFLGGSAGMLGIMVIIVSVIAAIPTMGLALIIGLPVGLILLLMGAGPIAAIFIWLLCLGISLFFVHRKINKEAEASDTSESGQSETG